MMMMMMMMNFLNRCLKKPQTSNSIKIHPVGTEFHADTWTDGQTYVTKLIVASRNVANTSENEKIVTGSSVAPVKMSGYFR
jgi:hypothetical protein